MTSTINNIITILQENKITIAAAESITAGLLQDALASETGASSVFRGGVTAYNIDTKEVFLGIDRDHAEKHNCVSEQTVQEMAKGVRTLFCADIGIATTGYAEQYDNEPAHAYYAIAIKDKLHSGVIPLEHTQGRQKCREAVRDFVITQLHAKLLSLFPPLEVEYKFAVKPEYFDKIKEQAETVINIKQCYLCQSREQTSRIRIIDDQEAYMTSKLENNVEVEFAIPLGHASLIYNAYKDGLGTIRKKRYIINDPKLPDGLKVEVDFFEGRHKGIVIAEIEVPYPNYKLTYLPEFIDTETNLSITSNATLALT